jgi:hypothetical protein
LRPEDSSSLRGIPCTGPARTILDLAAVVGAGWLRRAIGEAEVLGIVDLGDLRRQIALNRGRRGVARLRSWDDPKVLVEADGRRFHSTRTAFERDRRRDQRLIRSGWQVVRFTWRQVVDEPSYVSATVKAILSRGQGSMGPQIK